MKIKFNNRTLSLILFYSLLILPIFRMGYVSENEILSPLGDLGRYISTIFGAYFCLRDFSKIIKNKYLMLIFVIKFWILLLTVIKFVDNINALYSFVLIVSLGAIIRNSFEKDEMISLKALRLTFEIIVYINLFSMILYPDGLYNLMEPRIYNFIGHANNTAYYSIVLCVVSLLVYTHDKKVAHCLANFLVSIWTVLLAGSATGLVMIVVFGGMLVLEKKRPSVSFPLFAFFACISLVSCGIVFFNIQNLFSNFISSTLHRELDFTGRTYYWGKTIIAIKDNLILGHGYVAGSNRVGGLGAHNFILEALYIGGVILLAMLIFMYSKFSCLLKKHQGNVRSRILLSGIVAITISCITEANVGSEIFWVLFVLAALLFHKSNKKFQTIN